MAQRQGRGVFCFEGCQQSAFSKQDHNLIQLIYLISENEILRLSTISQSKWLRSSE
jgi:hypothetical protein